MTTPILKPRPDHEIDRELARSAAKKRQKGELPTARETAALKRVAGRAEEERRWNYYATVSQKHYRLMSGRKAQILQEQSERYGVPCNGAVIDIGKVLRAFHDLLAKYGRAISKADELVGGNPEAKRSQSAKADLLELERDRQRGLVFDASAVRETWDEVCVYIRNGLENVPSQLTPIALSNGLPHEAAAVFEDQVRQAVAGVLRHLSHGFKVNNDPPGDPEGGTGELAEAHAA